MIKKSLKLYCLLLCFNFHVSASNLKEISYELDPNTLDASLPDDNLLPLVTYEQLKQLSKDANQGDINAQYNLLKYFEKTYKDGLHSKLFIESRIIQTLQLQSWHTYYTIYDPVFATLCLVKARLEGQKWEMPSEVISQLKSAALEGDSWAQSNLGIMYYKGLYVKESAEESLNFFLMAAEQGFAPAATNLAVSYLVGNKFSKDINQAIKWGLYAASKGNIESYYILGLIYKLQENNEKMIFYFNQAGLKGFADGFMHLGSLYMEGKIVSKNHKEALRYFDLAADQGSPKAQLELGWHLLTSDIIPHNPERAFELFKHAAEQDYGDAYWSLALLYEEGKGVDKDDEQAFYYNRLAAKRGFIHSQRKLSLAYMYAKGTKENPDKGIKWALKVAKADPKITEDIEIIKAAQRDLSVVFTGHPTIETEIYTYTKLFDNVTLKVNKLIALNNTFIENEFIPTFSDSFNVPEFYEHTQNIAVFGRKVLSLIDILKHCALMVNTRTISDNIISKCATIRGKNLYFDKYNIDEKTYLSVGKKEVQKSKALISFIKEEDEDFKSSLVYAKTVGTILQKLLIPFLSKITILQSKARAGLETDLSCYPHLNAQAQKIQECITDVEECRNIPYYFKSLIHVGAFQRNRLFEEKYPFFE